PTSRTTRFSQYLSAWSGSGRSILFPHTSDLRGEIRVEGRHDLRPLAHGSGHAFHRARTDITHREYPATAGLHPQSAAIECLVGAHEALGVQGDVAMCQPTGIGLGADEEEDMTHRPRRLVSRLSVPPAHRFEHAA